VAGVGAAFLLMAALNRLLPGQPDDMRQYLDLVALGTIADVVPLTPENRILVKNGLLLLAEARRPGIFALKEASGLPPTAPMGSGQVGFSLAPRINAAGRLGSPRTALDLLLAPDLSSARPLAAELETLNRERRRIEDDILDQALEQAREQSDRAGLVLCDESWHQGVIGIVASRVVERSNRPVLLLTRDGGQLKGSGRSIPEFDLYQGLSECSEVLSGFGGHRQAAGVKIDRDRVEELRQAFHAAVVSQIGPDPLDPSLKLEAVLGLREVNVSLVKEIDLLQPFGPGNPQPVFRSRPLTVRKQQLFGKNHVSLEVRDEQAGVSMLGKAWRQADRLTTDLTGQSVLFAFTPRLNHYNGMTSIDLQVRDLCLAGELRS
jgi:single-stranded-DNA-specific exonuclease